MIKSFHSSFFSILILCLVTFIPTGCGSDKKKAHHKEREAAAVVISSLSSGSWRPTSTGVNCPEARRSHTAVWTGSEMIVWGGIGYFGMTKTGGMYDPASDTWVTTSTTGSCPSPRVEHSAVWTGSKMVIWGGVDNNWYHISSGGIFDPVTNSWDNMSEVNCPAGRSGHVTVWTGSKMIVWGGMDNNAVDINSGGLYDPVADSWESMSTEPPCPIPVSYCSHVWTGSKMIIWGGVQMAGNGSVIGLTDYGAMYDPSTNSWAAISLSGDTPSPSSLHQAVWTGEKMHVWGVRYGDYVNHMYDPAADVWEQVSGGGTRNEEIVAFFSMLWTGSSVIIWGGGDEYNYKLNIGDVFYPESGKWIPTNRGFRCPTGRYIHTAVWTGSQMIIWGGVDKSTLPVNTGGIFYAVSFEIDNRKL